MNENENNPKWEELQLKAESLATEITQSEESAQVFMDAHQTEIVGLAQSLDEELVVDSITEEELENSLKMIEEDLESMNQDEIHAVEEDANNLEDKMEIASENCEELFELDHFEQSDQEDKLWQAKTGLNTETLCGAIETIIFMNDKPVTIQKIKSFIDPDLPLRVIHESLKRLQEEYESSHHGIRLQEVAEGYQFRTKATFSKYVQDIFKVNSLVLSPSAMEVLAIIAYKQPISKSEVEKIRGVDSSHLVRGLMDKRLVKVAGRSDEAGRPSIYTTTTEFLEVFNLADISQLPPEYELEEMATQHTGAQISDIKSVVGGDKEKFKFDDLEELENLEKDIKAINSETDFTSSLKLQDKKRKLEDGSVAKSAFEVLEDFINSKQVVSENLKSSESETLSTFMEPRSVDLAKVTELLNTPEVDEFDLEELNAQMDDDEELNEAADRAIEDENLIPEAQPISEEEMLELSTALDDAFERLQQFQEDSDEEDRELAENVENMMGSLNETMEKISDQAKELDLDLDFLNESEHKDNETNLEDNF